VDGTTTSFLDVTHLGEGVLGGDSALAHMRVDVEGCEVVVHPVAGLDVTINDERLRASRALTAGDVIVAGNVSMVYSSRTGREVAETRLGFGALRSRLVVEVERSVRTHRPLAVMCIRPGTDDQRARDIVESMLRIVDLIAWLDGTEAVAVLPETAESAEVPASRIMDLLRPMASAPRIGIALCPHDAQGPDALITGARMAARAQLSSDIVRVADAARVVMVGEDSLTTLDPAMGKVIGLVERVARSDISTLVMGPTGTGKELVARALHEWSSRRDGPFVAINCAAVADSLFENELFGHEPGAFTDATGTKAGLIEKAHGGTLFLDEIGEMPPRLQPKLLRVLETGKVSRLGAVAERTVQVRIVAATNRDIEVEVGEGRFRQDLYYRLAAARVTIPALADRPLDIPVLARRFLGEACVRNGREVIEISPEAMRLLCTHGWPGNVRELRNAMELQASLLDGEALRASDLPAEIVASVPPWLVPGSTDEAGPVFGSFESRTRASLKAEVRELERVRITQALRATRGVQVRAAELLEMPLRTFISKIKEFSISPARFKKADGG
jgi:DNA-binding NtrC family response regulator